MLLPWLVDFKKITFVIARMTLTSWMWYWIVRAWRTLTVRVIQALNKLHFSTNQNNVVLSDSVWRLIKTNGFDQNRKGVPLRFRSISRLWESKANLIHFEASILTSKVCGSKCIGFALLLHSVGIWSILQIQMAPTYISSRGLEVAGRP